MIQVSDLAVTLGGWQILKGIDFHVERGETIALVGANGAGKTTILRCLLGLVHYHGRILVDGIDAQEHPVQAKKRIGYMPQVPVFCEDTVGDSLALIAALRGAPQSEIFGLFERVGLQSHVRRPVRVLSAGMRQRLSLAASLLGQPPVLVLDEPTASLDLRGQEEITVLLKELQREGKTILMSSHRAEEVRSLVHRIVVLDEGNIVAAGPVAEVSAQIWGENGLLRLQAFPRRIK